VRFHRHLRRQERFHSVDALVEQMHRDVAETRRVVPG
jgi:FAD synthase